MLIEIEKIEEVICYNFGEMEESDLYDAIRGLNYKLSRFRTERLVYYLDNMRKYYAFRFGLYPGLLQVLIDTRPRFLDETDRV